MIFDPKKGFLTPPHPNPPPLPTSLKTSKTWVSGGGGGSGPKTHWVMCLLDKLMFSQRVEPTIQPHEVGYVNSPKKAQNGGVFIRACAALI